MPPASKTVTNYSPQSQPTPSPASRLAKPSTAPHLRPSHSRSSILPPQQHLAQTPPLPQPFSPPPPKPLPPPEPPPPLPPSRPFAAHKQHATPRHPHPTPASLPPPPHAALLESPAAHPPSHPA